MSDLLSDLLSWLATSAGSLVIGAIGALIGALVTGIVSLGFSRRKRIDELEVEQILRLHEVVGQVIGPTASALSASEHAGQLRYELAASKKRMYFQTRRKRVARDLFELGERTLVYLQAVELKEEPFDKLEEERLRLSNYWRDAFTQALRA